MVNYYDTIYNEIVDYESEFKRLQNLIRRHYGGVPHSVLDLACGTGNNTFLFAKAGYKATGIDISPEMISAAKRKTESQEDPSNPQFFQEDMTHIESLPGSYDIASVLFGGFGYMHENTKIKRFFDGVRGHLNLNGLLIFDFWQSSGVFSQAKTSAGWKSWEKIEADEKLIIRLNTSKYERTESTMKVTFDFYVMDMRMKKLIDAFSERHDLRTHTVRSLRMILEDSGFRCLGFYNADSVQSSRQNPAKPSTFRVLSVARVKPP